MFRTYTELDLYELQAINKDIDEKLGRISQEIDPETILCTFDGHTIFSIYFDNIEVYEQIVSQLSECEWQKETNIAGDEVENSYTRRLMRILRLPTLDLLTKAKKKEID